MPGLRPGRLSLPTAKAGGISATPMFMNAPLFASDVEIARFEAGPLRPVYAAGIDVPQVRSAARARSHLGR